MADNIDEAVEAKFGHKKPQKFANLEGNNIKHIIGVVSGKGGVGKSMVTSLMAINMKKKGYNVGIMDCDITGPSIPKSFGLGYDVEGTDKIMYPPVTDLGIKCMSINLFLEDETQPVLWRGPVLGNAIRQFYSDTLWGDIDYLFVDMPPGTGDVALTVFQSLPIDGVIIVSTPQDLVKMIVGKAVNMANQMNVNIIGLVENMSYMRCSCCNAKLYPFGKSQLEEVASYYDLRPIVSMPIDPEFSTLVDSGEVEMIETDFLNEATKVLEEL